MIIRTAIERMVIASNDFSSKQELNRKLMTAGIEKIAAAIQ